jgi:hypothetical protein
MGAGEHQTDDAAETRNLGACCLKVLANMAHESPDPDVRAVAWKELGHSLVMLRRFLATTGSVRMLSLRYVAFTTRNIYQRADAVTL